MTDKEYILKLMYAAFIDIRFASHSYDYHTCFVLSDVFHNIPLRMDQAEKGNIEYADIVTYLHKKFEERNCVFWLDNARNNITG
ncbi:hypothetical protein [Dictyobacter arantiisoli]|uniref:Uncharacterized protein n=1 Tax=Dictyobacter arantiisoli TaxID=2014874 RepID=A0A5A5TFP7_9CHLR|nr:hypothetical protein [Dictyobacter arantiisoli]GCF10177.1 hypothetical protein KDI_37410 [Dictyobacter arantiisoli]